MSMDIEIQRVSDHSTEIEILFTSDDTTTFNGKDSVKRIARLNVQNYALFDIEKKYSVGSVVSDETTGLYFCKLESHGGVALSDTSTWEKVEFGSFKLKASKLFNINSNATINAGGNFFSSVVNTSPGKYRLTFDVSVKPMNVNYVVHCENNNNNVNDVYDDKYSIMINNQTVDYFDIEFYKYKTDTFVNPTNFFGIVYEVE